MQTSRERTDSYAAKGGHLLHQFQFSCIRSGNAAVLRSELHASLYRAGILSLYEGDVQSARISMTFVCAQAWYVAVQSGVPEKTVDNFFDVFSKQAYAASTVEQILNSYADLLISCAEAVDALQYPRIYSVTIQRCIAYIRAHLCQQLTVQQISAALGFNESYLSREFKKTTGRAMTSFIQNEKIQTAKFLLKNSMMSVQEIMGRLGYISQSHFTKLFREKTGTTPARYRTSRHASSRFNSIREVDQSSLQNREKSYYRLVNYGQQKGLEQQNYYLSCVRRGSVRSLKSELEKAEQYAEITALFDGKLDLAIEAFLSFWPLVMQAACDSGVPVSISTRNLSEFTARMYNCFSVGETLDLNHKYLLEQAQAVANII